MQHLERRDMAEGACADALAVSPLERRWVRWRPHVRRIFVGWATLGSMVGLVVWLLPATSESFRQWLLSMVGGSAGGTDPVGFLYRNWISVILVGIVPISSYYILYLVKKVLRFREQVYCFGNDLLNVLGVVGDIVETSRSTDLQEDKVLQQFQVLLDTVAIHFTRYTGDQCAVCIKILEEDKVESQRWIRTYARDSISKHARSAVDKEQATLRYLFESNTAFVRALGSHGPVRGFVENNLRKEAQAKRYENANPHWRKFYNASMVIPVAPQDPAVPNQALGFLCVDNMHGGFDRMFGLYLLSLFSKLIFEAMYPYVDGSEQFTTPTRSSSRSSYDSDHAPIAGERGP